MRESIVILGSLSHFPVAGVAWQTLHYLEGFRRLGYRVYYVEAHDCTPTKLMRGGGDDGTARAASHIAGILGRFGFGDQWAYHAISEGRTFGRTASQLRGIYRSASLVINLHGGHVPTDDMAASNRMVFLETDPVNVEIELHHGRQETIDYLAPHRAFFTFGENLGRRDCKVPWPERFAFRPTRQPVVMDFWESHGTGHGEAYTTIGNWNQGGREARLGGEVYSWSKHHEFLKFLDLPRLVAPPLELALASLGTADRAMLESHGWRVRPALEFSADLDAYRTYIGGSRGEFTVAKDQNVRLRSGWFSDRAATYLAAGRPVITQETGFSNVLPTGEGLFGFSTMDDIVAALAEIEGDPARHRRAAFRIARECFAHDVVLGKLLRDLGVTWPELARAQSAARTASTDAVNKVPLIPAPLELIPVGRWPTRLPKDTIAVARSLPVPPALPERHGPVQHPLPRASVVIVTHNGLAYTRLCIASLLGGDWQDGDELIVVDNASTDGTRGYLAELVAAHPRVQTIANDRNAGFAAGNNRGLERASGDVLVLLNNDTIVPSGWKRALVAHLSDPSIGMVGPVTNRTCNEAQVDAPYRTHGEMLAFADARAASKTGQRSDIAMLAMFCVALRRDAWRVVGPLDERFGVGMFEDDDYARRTRDAGFRVVCAEDAFVHHFGQGTIGELCLTGDYDRLLEANRGLYEQKWGEEWKPHGRRLTPEYASLRARARELALAHVPAGDAVVVISKGDDELVRLEGRRGWHFPRTPAGDYSAVYPADGQGAVAQLETLRKDGARFLLVPRTSAWWLEHYAAFGEHLERFARLVARDDQAGSLYALGNGGRDA